MSAIRALVDSNVLIAAVAEEHQHHEISLGFITNSPRLSLCVSAHSFAEAYSTLTRRNATAPFKWSAGEAWTAVESVAAITVLIGLAPGKTFDAIRAYATDGGIGARIYDHLIGQAAREHNLRRIVSWNIGHMRALFPDLSVADPSVAVT